MQTALYQTISNHIMYIKPRWYNIVQLLLIISEIRGIFEQMRSEIDKGDAREPKHNCYSLAHFFYFIFYLFIFYLIDTKKNWQHNTIQYNT